MRCECERALRRGTPRFHGCRRRASIGLAARRIPGLRRDRRLALAAGAAGVADEPAHAEETLCSLAFGQRLSVVRTGATRVSGQQVGAGELEAALAKARRELGDLEKAIAEVHGDNSARAHPGKRKKVVFDEDCLLPESDTRAHVITSVPKDEGVYFCGFARCPFAAGNKKQRCGVVAGKSLANAEIDVRACWQRACHLLACGACCRRRCMNRSGGGGACT